MTHRHAGLDPASRNKQPPVKRVALVIPHSGKTKEARQCYCLSFVYALPSRGFKDQNNHLDPGFLPFFLALDLTLALNLVFSGPHCLGIMIKSKITSKNTTTNLWY